MDAVTPNEWSIDQRSVGGARILAPPPRSLPLTLTAVVVGATVAGAFWGLGLHSVGKLHTSSGYETAATITVSALAGLATLVVLPGVYSLVLGYRARTLAGRGAVVEARHVAARARERAQRSLGGALAAVVLLAVTLFFLTNNAVVISTFFSWVQVHRSMGDVLRAAKLNLWMAAVSEAFILVWALTLALVRLAPGRAVAPLRWLAILYVDIFRAIPLIIVLYLVAFGIPIAEVPVLSNLPTSWLIVIGLTLTTSAYVAEVFRSGIESIHWSQTAASKSLGFSTTQTWFYVVVPQAMRRVIPPLLSYFIGLQKDTSLVLVVGAIDIFGQAKIYAGNYFNLSSVTFVAIVFIAFTIPQTRLVDYLLAREARRTGVRRL